MDVSIEDIARDGSSKAAWCPLSAIQKSLWFQYLFQPELRACFNAVFTARVEPSIDPQKLSRALDRVAARHPMLRARFAEVNDEVMQCVESHVRVPLEVYEVDSLEEEHLQTRIESDRARPFDLSTAPLMRASLYRCGTSSSVMLILFDHLICDGWSLWQMIEEIGSALQEKQLAIGREPPKFFTHVIEQQSWLTSRQGRKQLEYWRGVLGEPCAPLDLMTDHAQAEVRDTIPLAVKGSVIEALRRLSERHGVSMFVTLLASYFILLHRLSRQHRLAIGVPVPARGKQWGETVGAFTNPLVLHAEITAELSVAGLLKQLHSSVFRALKNQSYPFTELMERLNPQRTQLGQPYFQAMFASQKARAAAEAMGLMAHVKDIEKVSWGGYELSAFGRIRRCRSATSWRSPAR